MLLQFWPNKCSTMFGRFLLLFPFLLFFISANAQKRTISYSSEDNVEVFADQYYSLAEKPYVILFHKENSSRGEYKDIAQKLLNLEYNCLVVDMRVGGEANFVENKTSKSSQKEYAFFDCLKDVEASIDFAFAKSNKPVILFGSGFSASLCLIAANNNKKVQSVIAFSPGEYFMPNTSTQDKLKNYDKKVFIGARTDELGYAKELMSNVTNSLKIFSAYEATKQARGSLLLSEENKSNNKFWLDLLLFFKSLNP